MIYVHPLLGTLALALLVYIGIKGLRARHPKPYARPARRVHRKVSPVAAVLCGLSLVGGLTTTAWYREDLELGDSPHFLAGAAVTALMGALWLISRFIHRQRWAIPAHLVMGLVTLVVAAATFLLGLGLLP